MRDKKREWDGDRQRETSREGVKRDEKIDKSRLRKR